MDATLMCGLQQDGEDFVCVCTRGRAICRRRLSQDHEGPNRLLACNVVASVSRTTRNVKSAVNS